MWTIQTDCRNPLSPHYARLNRICMQLSLAHAHSRVPRSAGAIGLCIAVQPCSRSFACTAIPKMQPRPTSTSNRPEPSPPSPAENRCYAAPLPQGRALPPLPARPSLPPRPAANQRPAHRHRSLSEHNQPPPPSRIANGQRSQPSTRPGFRTSHRPPVRPVTNAVAFGQLRAQRCRSRLALPPPPAHPQPPARFPPPISRTPARPLPQAPSRLDRTSSGGDAPGRKRSRRPLSQRTPPAIPPSAAPSDALPYALPPGWPPWSTLVASGCSFSVSMRTNPTISNGTTYRKMGTSASE